MSKPLSIDEIETYLDNAIKYWRKIRDNPSNYHRSAEGLNSEAAVAPCYIDAFQSMRFSVFGETLP